MFNQMLNITSTLVILAKMHNSTWNWNEFDCTDIRHQRLNANGSTTFRHSESPQWAGRHSSFDYRCHQSSQKSQHPLHTHGTEVLWMRPKQATEWKKSHAQPPEEQEDGGRGRERYSNDGRQKLERQMKSAPEPCSMLVWMKFGTDIN